MRYACVYVRKLHNSRVWSIMDEAWCLSMQECKTNRDGPVGALSLCIMSVCKECVYSEEINDNY